MKRIRRWEDPHNRAKCACLSLTMHESVSFNNVKNQSVHSELRMGVCKLVRHMHSFSIVVDDVDVFCKCETISASEWNAACVSQHWRLVCYCSLPPVWTVHWEGKTGCYAITISPGCRCWKSPQSAVIALSAALLYRSLVKVITPLGVTPIRAFSVVSPLYWLYKWLY